MGGEQPAFDWLKYDSYDSPAIMFARVALEKGAAVALDQFSKEIASGAIAEGTINQTGYSLMGGRKVPDAILVMRKNVGTPSYLVECLRQPGRGVFEERRQRTAEEDFIADLYTLIRRTKMDWRH